MSNTSASRRQASVRKLARVASALDSKEQLVIGTGGLRRVNREKWFSVGIVGIAGGFRSTRVQPPFAQRRLVSRCR
jgi:hypothetical protein